MFPKLVATDLDGTLLRSDGTIDQRTRDAITAVRRAGTPVVLCTARPARWMGSLALAIGARGAAICANGAVIWDLDREAVLHQSPIDPETARDVVARLRAALPAAAWAVERAAAFGHEPGYTPRWPVPEDTVVDHVEALLSVAPVKLMLRCPGTSADALVARARAAVGGLVEVTHSSSADTLLEMSAAGVSKGSALAALCAQRGIAAEQVVAFGDMPNDLPMLAWAGRGVAVANAHRDVLAGADEVTASNDESGLAQVLERLLAERSPSRRAEARLHRS